MLTKAIIDKQKSGLPLSLSKVHDIVNSNNPVKNLDSVPPKAIKHRNTDLDSKGELEKAEDGNANIEDNVERSFRIPDGKESNENAPGHELSEPKRTDKLISNQTNSDNGVLLKPELSGSRVLAEQEKRKDTQGHLSNPDHDQELEKKLDVSLNKSSQVANSVPNRHAQNESSANSTEVTTESEVVGITNDLTIA